MKRIVLIVALCAGMVLTGCGGSSSSATADSAAAYDGGYAKTSNFATADTAADWDYEEAAAEEAPAAGIADDITDADIVGQQSKIIRNADISMDVSDLNEFAVNLRKTVESYKGYMERSSINDYDSDYSEYRYGYFTVRVPASRLDDFLNIVEEEGTITSKSESAEDVTLQYVDIEAHIDTYEAERDSLMELMGKAESVEDILTIREQLRDINYELDSLNRQCRSEGVKINNGCCEEELLCGPYSREVYGRVCRRLGDSTRCSYLHNHEDTALCDTRCICVYHREDNKGHRIRNGQKGEKAEEQSCRIVSVTAGYGKYRRTACRGTADECAGKAYHQ